MLNTIKHILTAVKDFETGKFVRGELKTLSGTNGECNKVII